VLTNTVKGEFYFGYCSDIISAYCLLTAYICLDNVLLVAMLGWQWVWRPVITSVLQREWNREIQRGEEWRVCDLNLKALLCVDGSKWIAFWYCYTYSW